MALGGSLEAATFSLPPAALMDGTASSLPGRPPRGSLSPPSPASHSPWLLGPQGQPIGALCVCLSPGSPQSPAQGRHCWAVHCAQEKSVSWGESGVPSLPHGSRMQTQEGVRPGPCCVLPPAARVGGSWSDTDGWVGFTSLRGFFGPLHTLSTLSTAQPQMVLVTV